MTVLVIAATDSSGGAGLTRDAVVANELGEPVVFAATAVTAQTHDAVERVQPMDAALVAAQIAAAVATTSIDAVKIGLVPSAAVIEAIAQSLKQHKLSQVVLDPIMVASSGDRLIADGPLDILGPLLPLVRLVTPNLPELVQLCGEGSPLENARLLQSRGAVAVLVKGGHGGKPTVTDWLIEDQVEALTGQRLPGQLRGTGCMLSTAIAVHLSRKKTLRQACVLARSYVVKKLASA